jgi:hypothetical protein
MISEDGIEYQLSYCVPEGYLIIGDDGELYALSVA